MKYRRISKITTRDALMATVFMMLFSMINISKNAEHDCTGSQCTICIVMQQCSNNLKTIGTAVAVVSISFFLFKQNMKDKCNKTNAFSCNSLMSQEVSLYIWFPILSIDKQKTTFIPQQ